jgi:hypothetical protein
MLRFMSRLTSLSLVIALALIPVTASAASKKHAKRAQSTGLPGYVQPPSNSVPLFMQKLSPAQVALLRQRRPWYIDRTPGYYRWNGDYRYLGRPGFYRGRYNGGSIGPCWTQTPIGPMWNCGR